MSKLKSVVNTKSNRFYFNISTCLTKFYDTYNTVHSLPNSLFTR